MTQEEVLRRYPRLVAHLICESLGYLTPKSAANWILADKSHNPFWCEWSVHMVQSCDPDCITGIEWREELLEPPPWENKSEATNG